MSGDIVRFRAPWSAFVTVVTIVAGVLLVAAVASTTGRYPALAALLALVLVVSAALAPRAYLLGRDALIVERWVLPVRIPLSRIQRIEAIDPKELRGAIRTFGSGGLFGIYGRFWSRKFGHFRM